MVVHPDMTRRSRHCLVFSTAGLLLSLWGCGTEQPGTNPAGTGGTPPGTGGIAASPAVGGTAALGTGGTGAGVSTGGSGTGGAAVPCVPEAFSETTHSAGNYDNLSCNRADCHVGEVGGWVYSSARGYPWVAGATVTITNSDGTQLVAVSGEDGFFHLGTDPIVSVPYDVCVSKCPSTDCNLTPHTSLDCLSANCHAIPGVRIYTTTPGVGGTGGTAAVPGENCQQPTPGGPYVHLEAVYSAYNNQPCVNCHSTETPQYKGGFLYDDPSGDTTVPEATVTIRPAAGPELTAVTGPDGMFFFGTVGITTTAQAIPTPYTACVSKCPTSEICSLPNEHITDADCGTCHDTYTESPVYLQ